MQVEASEEVRLEEINFYNARARAEPVMQELLAKTLGCKAADKSKGRRAGLLAWVASEEVFAAVST